MIWLDQGEIRFVLEKDLLCNYDIMTFTFDFENCFKDTTHP